MSRIGRRSVQVPKGAKVALSGNSISVEGPKGSLKFAFSPKVRVAMGEGGASVVVNIEGQSPDDREARALWGTTRAIINNMMVGVTKGYEKKMEVVGVGWTAELSGKLLKLKVGFANVIQVAVPQGLTVAVDKQQLITITGADKQAVGQFAAQLRAHRKPEPYNGKGIKYQEEVIQRKQGKAVGK